MGALQRLAHLLARILHGLARALEGRRVDPLDAATAALAQRFPGAPDHWLRYIAARAPHLAAAHVEDARGDAAIDRGYSPPKIRWWWPRAAASREAPQRVERSAEAGTARQAYVTPERRVRAESGPVGASPAERKRGVFANSPESRPPVVRRAGLRIVGGKSTEPLSRLPSEPSSRSSKEPSPHAADEMPKTEADLKMSLRERIRRPGLRIASARSSESSRAELALNAPPYKPAPEPHRALAAGPPLTPPHDPPAPTIDLLGIPERAPSADLIGQQDISRSEHPSARWTSSPSRAESELVLSARRAASKAPTPAWTAQGSSRITAEFPSRETGRSHWPQLLPPEPSDVDNAPTPLPDIGRLRAEQDFGAWSG